jgi:1-acyl-sn-glycerol-3-phosphate acyltransferase
LYQLIKKIVAFLLPKLAKLEIIGAENFPSSGPYILTINHLSAFDTPILLVTCPHRVTALAADKHRGHWFFGPLLSIMGSVWVRRGEIDRQAIRGAIEVLEQGEVLGMAPEGTRARDVYALQEGKNGPAYLATRANALIVPVGIAGTEKIKDELPKLRRARVRVEVGKPFKLPESGRIRGERLTEFTDIIMKQIAVLLPEEYRGAYAGRVNEPETLATN